MRPATTSRTLVSSVSTVAKYLFFFAVVAAILAFAVTSARSGCGASSPFVRACDAAGVTAWGPYGVLCDESRWSAMTPAKQLDVARTLYAGLRSHGLLPADCQQMPISTDPTAYDRHPAAFYDVTADAVIPAAVAE